MINTANTKKGDGWTNLKKIKTDYNCGFRKLVSRRAFKVHFCCLKCLIRSGDVFV